MKDRLGRLAVTGALGLGAAVSLVLFASWYGCNIYNSSLILPASEGGTDAGSATEAAPTCLAKWPAPPAQDDPSSGAPYSGFVVMQTVDVGASADGGVAQLDSSAPLPPIGFDLDNDCTCCSGNGGPMCITGGSCLGQNGVICDDNAGRDHVALNIFRVLPNASAAANAGMQAGQFSIILQISGYNGTPNDTNVTVALYVSNGMDGIQDGGTVMPHHDGTDLWTVDSHYLTTQNGGTVPDGTECNGTTACQPAYLDDNAYVSGGVLVAIPQVTYLPLTFGYRANIGGALMWLSGSVISGTLRPFNVDGGATLWGIANGSISGRWDSSKLLGNLATLPNADVDGSYLCKTDPYAGMLYAAAKTYICSLQDIMTDKMLDNTMGTCDALSMSFGFTAEPALIGSVYSVSPPPSGCATEAGVFTDSCLISP